MPIHENLATALAAFQAELPPLTKDERAKVQGTTKDGRNYDKSYDYSGLDQFVEIVEPVLGRHGLSVTSKATLDVSGNFTLEVSLLHETGEREISYWPLPDPRRSGPQDIGSAMTYGRRYLGWGLTGTFPGGQDDDGAGAQAAPRDSWDDAKPARPAQAPPADPPKAPKTAWTDEEVFSYQEKMPTAELEKVVKAYDWMAGKGLHNRAVPDLGDAQQRPRTATDLLAVRLADEALVASNTPGDIAALKVIAVDRGLLKVQVSETETLDQVIFEAAELATHAAVQNTVAAAKGDTPRPEDTK